MRSPYLYMQLFNTSLQALPPNFFKHMGRVRNISLDIRYHNQNLKKIPNPNTGSVPYLPNSVFLTDLKMSRTDLNCDCDLGYYLAFSYHQLIIVITYIIFQLGGVLATQAAAIYLLIADLDRYSFPYVHEFTVPGVRTTQLR